MILQILYYKFFKKHIAKNVIKSISKIRKYPVLKKLGFFVLNSIKIDNFVFWVSKKLVEGYFLYYYKSEVNLSKKYIKILSEIADCYGVILIIDMPEYYIFIKDNRIKKTSIEDNIKNNIIYFVDSKILLLDKKNFIDTVCLLRLKLKQIDFIFTRGKTEKECQDYSNILFCCVFNGKEVYTPIILESIKVMENNSIYINMNSFRKERDFYVGNNKLLISKISDYI